MRFTSRASVDGVLEQDFLHNDIPGVRWTPDDDGTDRPLILLGHGGGQHSRAPGVLAGARRFVTEGGFTVVALDAPAHGGRPRTAEHEQAIAHLRAGGGPAALHRLLAEQSVPEWQAVLDALPAGPVGYFGLSMGCALGIALIAREPRIHAAVLGLLGREPHEGPTGPEGLEADEAARVTVPVQFLMQWDDALVPRHASLALFDRLGSAEKTLHANPGGHGDVPRFETGNALRFFARHLR
ncbi:alpha/beta hydrolase [Catenuloplanes sp. NPDC051500]|uniref:alpha/beta hydrolase n=1 Tax=Catenuloplanes sp. NPDC051500 TaxID=3363959 RepID=UPI003796C48C